MDKCPCGSFGGRLVVLKSEGGKKCGEEQHAVYYHVLKICFSREQINTNWRCFWFCMHIKGSTFNRVCPAGGDRVPLKQQCWLASLFWEAKLLHRQSESVSYHSSSTAWHFGCDFFNPVLSFPSPAILSLTTELSPHNSMICRLDEQAILLPLFSSNRHTFRIKTSEFIAILLLISWCKLVKCLWANCCTFASQQYYKHLCYILEHYCISHF